MKRILAASVVGLVAVLLLAGGNPQAGAQAGVSKCDGHFHKHTGPEHKRFAFKSWRSFRVPEWRKVKHGHMMRCSRWLVDRRAMRHHWDKAKRLHNKRYHWRILFEKEDEGWQAWARSTSACESDYPSQHDPTGTFHGGFQFMLSTWASSPGSPGGDPHTFGWYTQAVVAINLAQRDGTQHWPNCG